MIMGVVGGLTEFLPILSTGILIITQHLLGLEAKWGKDAVDAFLIIIQLGAILAVWRHIPAGSPDFCG